MDIFAKEPSKRLDFENVLAIARNGDETRGFTANPDDNSPCFNSPKEYGFPEGGVQSWLVVFGAWCGLFAALGTTNTIAAFQSYVSTHQLSRYDNGTIGWVFSVYTFLAYFCGVYIGPLFDRFGPRWLILAGTLAMTGGFMLLSICNGRFKFSKPVR
ncbi:MFS transporter, MCP family, solute carrier family 16 (monocarboxylic acid transporters), member 10 [Fusarium oxysporum f. sp. pisi HDV247]|uniref:MFS transporter, MCP family, solute carrier family 16 (Monocarboxylic acid transporters), member 10 n=1 Tax=Fusarium oxysporum f. sp. pisi HDV247 TaxID=1080344 RepID=W9NUS1_FUSOX|nr:MFS transporter, MCP family, solute carrier family 16 (monocarboxylic acid transporters), member 10 [Fusarium oxysporum f. sp. pisi HDV247]